MGGQVEELMGGQVEGWTVDGWKGGREQCHTDSEKQTWCTAQHRPRHRVTTHCDVQVHVHACCVPCRVLICGVCAHVALSARTHARRQAGRSFWLAAVTAQAAAGAAA